MNDREVGDEREEILEDSDFRLYFNTLGNAGVGATVITSAFFYEQPMKTGRRRCPVCQPSIVIQSDSESLAGISERDHVGLKWTHN